MGAGEAFGAEELLLDFAFAGVRSANIETDAHSSLSDSSLSDPGEGFALLGPASGIVSPLASDCINPPPYCTCCDGYATCAAYAALG